MKRTGIVTVTRKPGDPLRDTGTDWAKVAALTPEQIHAAALADPDAQPLPRDMRGLTKLVNVKKLREKLGLTQEAFSEAYRIPLGTLRLGTAAQVSRCSRARLPFSYREGPGRGCRSAEKSGLTQLSHTAYFSPKFQSVTGAIAVTTLPRSRHAPRR
jgi:putative transcriptional regulator